MKGDERATGSRVRKRAVGILVSCLGFVLVASFIISGILGEGSLTAFIQHLSQPSMLVCHFIVFLSIPAFMLIGYFYVKQQNLAENLEQMVEEKASRLCESETRLTNVFAASPDAITVVDLNGNIIECNEAALDVLGYLSKNEAIGKSGFAFIAKKDRQRAMDNLKNALEQGSVRNIEYTLLAKDGHELPAELSASVIKDSSGNPTGFVAIIKDVTERKKAEQVLRESEEKYRSLFANMLNGFAYCRMIFDEKDKPIDFVYLEVNDAFEKLTGLKKEDVIGKKVTEAIPGTEKANPELFGIYSRVALTGKEEDFEIFFKPLNMWLSISVYSPKKGYFVAVFGDITDRKRAEEELRKSERKYRTLLENVPQKIFLKDRNSVYVSCNENYARDLKIKSNEIMGKTDYDFHPKELAEKYRVDDKRIMGSGKVEDIEEEYVQNEQKVFVHTVKTPVKDENGNVVGLLGIFWDITERRLMEQKYAIIVKTALDGFWINDNKGRLTAVNDAYCEMIGYTREELLSMSIQDIEALEKREETAGRIKKILEEGYDRFETRHRRKDGTVIDVEVSANYYIVGEGQLVVFVRNITERKNMEKQLKEYSEHLEEKVEERTNQLKKAQEQLLKAEKLAAIGEVATMVGHDLRNPLQAMVNTLYLAGKKSESIPITEKEILEKHGFLDLRSGVLEQVEYMDKIVSDLQDFARPVKPMPVEIGLHQLINRTLSSLTVPENVKVSIVIEEDFSKLILDPILMQRVFSNLITNAVQAMPDGGKLTIRASKKEETALINVEDTGVGISNENLSKLFVPLFTTKAKGQGFGLPVCKRMVEAHDGNITVESKVGKGSTFTVEIPLRKEVSYK